MSRGDRLRRAGSFVPMCLCAALLTMQIVAAQTSSPPERTFHVSKADVEKALHSIQSYPGGKLPVLEGFADPAGHALDSYHRGYYEYEVQLKPTSTSETAVRVTAKITAWYTGSSPNSSGYRLLKSSGRLESDLLDALTDKLNPNAANKTSASAATSAAPLPDTPTVGSHTFFNTPRLTTAPSGTKPVSAPMPAKPADPATAGRIKSLTEQEQGLEQVLHNQVRPDNLAVVKRSNTPVVVQPLDGAEVLFQADAEDEFEILDSNGDWVHIKISGISRGWIKRDYVDLPGAATVSLSALPADKPEGDLVRQTKQQVGTFPGSWQPLDGKQVKIIWVQPRDKDQFGAGSRWGMAKSVFRQADAGSPADAGEIAGVVVIFDSQDGGMAATTLANLQQWRAGHLSDETFWKRCWRDPAEAFTGQN